MDVGRIFSGYISYMGSLFGGEGRRECVCVCEMYECVCVGGGGGGSRLNKVIFGGFWSRSPRRLMMPSL